MKGKNILATEVPRMEQLRQSDADLIKQIARNRSTKSFEELVKRQHRAWYALAKMILREDSLVEDALQEAMLIVWRMAHTFKRDGNARAWILKIVERECYRIRARHGRLETSRAKARVLTEDSTLPPGIPENSELQKALGSLLCCMPLVDQKIIALRFSSNLTQQQVADTLNLPQTTISQKIRKVLNELRQKLSRLGFASSTFLLSDQTFQEALVNWTRVPGDLSIVLSHPITAPNGPPLPNSTSRVSQKTALLTGAIAMTIVGAVGAVIWHNTGTARSATAQPVPLDLLGSTHSNSETTSKAKVKKLSWHWDFDQDKPLPEFGMDLGGWSHQQSGGLRDSGCMQIKPGGFMAKFKIPVERYPIRIRIHHRGGKGSKTLEDEDVGYHHWQRNTFSSGHGDIGLCWTRFDRPMADFKHIGVVVGRPDESWMVSTFYVTGTKIIRTSRLSRMREDQAVITHLLVIKRFESAPLGWITRSPLMVDELEVKQVDESSVPNVDAHLEALDRIPMEKRVGKVFVRPNRYLKLLGKPFIMFH